MFVGWSVGSVVCGVGRFLGRTVSGFLLFVLLLPWPLPMVYQLLAAADFSSRLEYGRAAVSLDTNGWLMELFGGGACRFSNNRSWKVQLRRATWVAAHSCDLLALSSPGETDGLLEPPLCSCELGWNQGQPRTACLSSWRGVTLVGRELRELQFQTCRLLTHKR